MGWEKNKLNSKGKTFIWPHWQIFCIIVSINLLLNFVTKMLKYNLSFCFSGKCILIQVCLDVCTGKLDKNTEQESHFLQCGSVCVKTSIKLSHLLPPSCLDGVCMFHVDCLVRVSPSAFVCSVTVYKDPCCTAQSIYTTPDLLNHCCKKSSLFKVSIIFPFIWQRIDE